MIRKKNFTIATKFQLMRIDLDLEEICRISRTVPSDYVLGKKMLDEARPLIRTNTKKASKLISKARGLFMEESVPAADFNRIYPDIQCVADALRREIESYRKNMETGKFKEARTNVERMRGSSAAKNMKNTLIVSATRSDTSGNYCVCVTNRTDSDANLISFIGNDGTQNFSMYTDHSMFIKSKCTTTVSLYSTCESLCTINLNYESNGLKTTIRSYVRN